MSRFVAQEAVLGEEGVAPSDLAEEGVEEKLPHGGAAAHGGRAGLPALLAGSAGLRLAHRPHSAVDLT